MAKVFEKYPYIFYFLTPELDNMNMFLSCLSNVTVHKDLFFGSLSSIVVNTEYPNAPKVRVKIKPSKETMVKIARESTKYAKSIGKLGARFIEHMRKVGVDKNEVKSKPCTSYGKSVKSYRSGSTYSDECFNDLFWKEKVYYA